MDWMSGYRLPTGSNGDLVESAGGGGHGTGGMGNGSGDMTSPIPSTPSPSLASPWGAASTPQVKQEAVSPSPTGHTSISAPGSIKGKSFLPLKNEGIEL